VLAIIGAGHVFVGTNPSYTVPELTHATKIAKVKLVLTEPEIVTNMQTALAANGVDAGGRVFILDTRPGQIVPGGMKSWTTLCDHGSRDWIRFEDEARQRDTTACLFYTSGTTGLPKCGMTSHLNLVAEHILFCAQQPKDYQIRAVQIFPLFHIGAFPVVLVSQFKEGREAHIMRRFELEPYLSYHSRYDITEVFMAPPMVIQVVMSTLADPKAKNYKSKYSMKSVRRGFVGAAPLSSDIQKRFHALLGDGARLTQIWGMTETTSMATTVSPEVADKTVSGEIDGWGNVGRHLPEIHMKLVDENGNDVTEAGRGEACVKGPTVIRGYFENEKANRESWDADGYFHTGDVIQVDPKTGLFYIVERMKELIKVRGFQVAPAELEGVLTSHPDVVDAGVIGVPDEKSGELPRAYVVTREGSKVTAGEIKAYAGERLARYKSLKGGIILVPSIPKLASGKILKRVLREWAKKDKAYNPTPKL
jgi:4-coumarate--CoA ligase